MPHYIQGDGPSIQERGREAVKEPHPVWLVESDVPFSVSTNEGTLNGNAGDYVAYDPMSGHVWPVSAEYVDIHYAWIDEGEPEESLAERAQAREQSLHDKLAEMEETRTALEKQNSDLLTQLRDSESKLSYAQQEVAEYKARDEENVAVPDQPTGD